MISIKNSFLHALELSNYNILDNLANNTNIIFWI